MSPKGTCSGNAPAESFRGHVKQDLSTVRVPNASGGDHSGLHHDLFRPDATTLALGNAAPSVYAESSSA